MKILLLEDDEILRRELEIYLESQGLFFESVSNGNDFFLKFSITEFDLFLLDIHLPDNNGLKILEFIRESSNEVPVVIITAFSELSVKSEAFNVGVDDYLVKPFHFEELLMRIQSIGRRLKIPDLQLPIHKIGDLTINENFSEVRRQGKLIELTPKEYQVLLVLAKAKGRNITKSYIAGKIWDEHFESNYKTIEVYINFLRKKIDRDFHNKLIHTRIGFGYSLKLEDNDT